MGARRTVTERAGYSKRAGGPRQIRVAVAATEEAERPSSPSRADSGMPAMRGESSAGHSWAVPRWLDNRILLGLQPAPRPATIRSAPRANERHDFTRDAMRGFAAPYGWASGRISKSVVDTIAVL